ncbi:DUF4276 family protein [Emticicia sp. 21SJ11W-3]|uniref:DUF4276 family protein n=1 Tax=Emticicia sp. 21SJ11W-3 TaxID=2916755 RepID=UPI0020A14D55|nr:DUF4276 family protein [Emticicia sp. 21SJ11W-3]UTA66291.1 DUF4276 family protein [Emticicia sp. 21SJ11W-3]
MKRLIIICEGETEQQFCQTLLYTHFYSKGKIISAPKIKQSNGGIVSWKFLKKDIENLLKSDPTSLITTLIDYYGLEARHSFPNWQIAQAKTDVSKRILELENGMKEDIEESSSRRFIPYIQLHEFEGLLFNDINVFSNFFNDEEIVGKEELKNVFTKYENPEMINNHFETAPSNRLKRIIKGYDKTLYGSMLAEYIGLENLRRKSPRFNAWITTLENL